MREKKTGCLLSFVVPTFNEEVFIAKNLATIKLLMKNMEHEVIVADNGSEDETVEIVKKSGAILFVDSSKTVAGLRNLGAKHAKGDVLVFLDADVQISEQWVEKVPLAMRKMNSGTNIITGSRCGVGENPSWIERYWFLPMTKDRSGFVNSGHLIVRKDVYDELDGFDESLETSEDYEFCMRAARKGILLENNPELHVIHEGCPKTIGAFVRREIWHGSEDFKSFQKFIGSKVAVAGFFYCFFLTLSAVLMFYSAFYSLFFLMGNFILAMILTLIKSRKYPLNVGMYFLLYNIYLFSRGLSLSARIISVSNVRGRTNR